MPDSCDVAIVGGGVAGCATAYHLTRGGARVTVLEKGQVNGAASSQNAGSLHFHLEPRMVEHGADTAERFALAIPLLLRAEATWRGLQDELGQDIELHLHGGLVLAETPEEIDVLERKVALENRWGLQTTMISGDEARELAPALAPAVAAASFYAGEGHANPRVVAPAFLAAARSERLTVRTETRVTGLHRDGGRWRLRLGDGDALDADAVVLAAGAWTSELAALAHVNLPVAPISIGMMATARTAPLLDHLIQHVGARLTIKQVRDGNVLIGGGWPSHLAADARGFRLDASPALLSQSISGSASVARRAVPDAARLPVLRVWSGLAGVMVDGHPLLGEVPRRPGLYALNPGAFTLGPVCGEIMSRELLHGERPEEYEGWRPARFGHLNFEWGIAYPR